MSIVEIRYEAKCKHCFYKGRYYKGKLTRHKCMYGYIGEHKTTKDIEDYNGKSITLKDRACENFKL